MTKLDALKIQAEYLLAKMEHGKGYRITDLNQRLRQAADENPGDIVIRSVASVIDRMQKKDPNSIVTQGQLENVYQELVGLNPNNRFREVLGDLLQSEKTAAPVTNEEFVGAIRDSDQDMLQYDTNPKGFEYLFEPDKVTYDPKKVSNAKEKVELELRSLGVDNPRVRLAGGNSRFLLFSANLDTNMGTVPIYVPADSSGETLPSVFVGSNFEHLTHSNLSQYVKNAAYDRNPLPRVESVLSVIDEVLGASQKNIGTEEFDKTANSMPDTNEGLSAPSLFAELSDEQPRPDVSIPEVPLPKELKSLAPDIEESVIEASVGYPQASVRLAKRMIIAELASMGFKNSQIRIAAPTNDGFICEAVFNAPKGKMKIEIPIEMNGDAPLLPSVFAKDDYIADFNKANLQALVLKEGGYVEGLINSDNNLYGISLAELKQIMNKCALQGDFTTCDDVLEVIADRFNEDVYRSSVADYHNILSKIGNVKDTVKQAYEDHDQFIKTPNSIYPVHKKLGLPAHELIRDENGTWHRRSTYASKQNQEQINAFFSTSKVLVGD